MKLVLDAFWITVFNEIQDCASAAAFILTRRIIYILWVTNLWDYILEDLDRAKKKTPESLNSSIIT